MAHYDIFRDQLGVKYPAFGHALWEPNPGRLYSPVEVGDVGFIREGKFHRLFNALLPANHPSHQRFGVPEYYEPLRPSLADHIDSGVLTPNDFCSYGVTTASGGLEIFAREPLGSADVSFSCARKCGAVLSLPVTAQREDTIARGDFAKWITRNIDSWFAFTRRHGLGIDQMEDIVLVTGRHRTKSWTNIAFNEGQADAQVTFGVQVTEDVSASINWQVSRTHIQGAMLSQGPSGGDLPENQCIFVRGFRVARAFKFFPRLRGAAGDTQDPGEHDCEPELEVVSISNVTKYRDPLHVLLECIAERAPDCELVLVHDDDLHRLRGNGDGAALETLQPDAVVGFLQGSKLEIARVACDSLSSENNIPRSNTRGSMVAMFSEELSSWGGRDGQDRGSRDLISTGKSQSESGELQQTLASAASASSHPIGRGRRSGNALAPPTMARLNLARLTDRHVVQVTREDPTTARTTAFQVKADKMAAINLAESSRQQRSPVEQPPSKAQIQHMNGATFDSKGAGAGGAPRRGIIESNSSSEYDTTDTNDDDDDSWASDNISEMASMRPTDKQPPTNEEPRLREAVLESQRQRELFVKQPRRSYSNVGRTQYGLLPPLLNPDPTVFSHGHPSTHVMTRPPPALTSGESSAALTQAVQTTAQAPTGAATLSGHGNVYGGYQQKGHPQGEELESESDKSDDADDTIQVPRSSEERLMAALRNSATRRGSDNQSQLQAPGRGMGPWSLLPTATTAPIPFGRPWNLPPPELLMMTRPARRQMLTTEPSESPQPNLIRERQVGKLKSPSNARRRKSKMPSGGGGTSAAGLRAAGAVNEDARPSSVAMIATTEPLTITEPMTTTETVTTTVTATATTATTTAR